MAMPMSTLMRRPVRRIAMAVAMSVGMPRLRAVLFCVPMGMIPRVARVPARILATAETVPSPPQTTNIRIPSARASWTALGRSQPASTRKASGTSFQASISWMTSRIPMGDPLAAPALGLKISLARMSR